MCGCDHAPHFRNVALHSAQSNKLGMCQLGDDVGEGGFAGAGWAGENYRGQTIGFDGATQKFARPEDVFLTDELLQRPRPHARGERGAAVDLAKIDIFGFAKQIVHAGKIRRQRAYFQLSAAPERA